MEQALAINQKLAADDPKTRIGSAAWRCATKGWATMLERAGKLQEAKTRYMNKPVALGEKLVAAAPQRRADGSATWRCTASDWARCCG